MDVPGGGNPDFPEVETNRYDTDNISKEFSLPTEPTERFYAGSAGSFNEAAQA